MKKTSIRMASVMALSVLAIAGCKHEGSAVQKQYAADRAECREYAEKTIGVHGGAAAGRMSTGREHIALVDQFARCMHKRGWAVNKPPSEGKK